MIRLPVEPRYIREIDMLRLVTTTALLFALASVARAESLSIPEFIESRAKWAKWATGKTPLTIEGRYSSISASSNLLRFLNCDVAFRMQRGFRFARVAPSVKVLQAIGTLQAADGGFEFIVERVRTRPDDLKTFSDLAKLIPATRPVESFRFASQVADRAWFYRDEKLLKLAVDLHRQGVMHQKSQLKQDDADGLAKLAENLPLPEGLVRSDGKSNDVVAAVGAAARVVGELFPDKMFGVLLKHVSHLQSLSLLFVHESVQRRIAAAERTAGENEPADYTAVLAEIARRWPESLEPLKPPRPELRGRYLDDPQPVYAAASAEERKLLHRIACSELAFRTILAKVQPDGRNGFAIAAEIERRVPEKIGLADGYRKRELDYRFGRIAQSTRKEILELSMLFRQRNDEDRSRKTIATWIAAQEKRFRRSGADGLVQLADEYVRLLEDDKTAVRLLKEAWAINPRSEEIAARLERYGWHRHKDRWLTTDQMKNLPKDPIEEAIARGQALPGMTPAQIRRARGGDPTSIARIVSGGKVHEIWTYSSGTDQRVIVHFLHDSRTKSTAKALRVLNAAPVR